MQGYFNIKIDGREYGVLVRSSRYRRTYHRANSTFKKESANKWLKEEFTDFLKRHPCYKEKFLKRR